jgi:hypothetical protein
MNLYDSYKKCVLKNMKFFCNFLKIFLLIRFSTKFIEQTCFEKLDFFHEHNELLFLTIVIDSHHFLHKSKT